MTTTTLAPRVASTTRTLTLVGLGTCWVALALAETLLGDLDALGDAATLADGQGRVAAAGLLHVLAGFLLVLGLVGLGTRAEASRLTAVGLVGAALLAASLGGFGMLHLLALEMVDEDLDKLQGFGTWGVPVLVVGLLGTWLLLLLLVGLARGGDVPWWTVGTVLVGSLMHLFGWNELAEVSSHWLVAAGVAGAAAAVARD
jgi:hypothetical protein